MGWNNENGKHFDLVCATHDKELGRRNLITAGMSLEEAILFEKYCHLTVDDASPPDWQSWFEHQTNRLPTPLKKLQPLPLSNEQPATLVALLNLSPRIQNTLRRNNIITIGQLVDTSDTELLKLRTMGAKGLQEIREQLKESGREP